MILSGRDLQWYIDQHKLRVHPVEEAQFQQNGLDLILQDVKHVHGLFYLGHTRESFEFPDDLMAFVNLRSTWARMGFTLPPTIVDAGFRGDLTLEIVNHGLADFPIGQRFAHLIFSKLSNPTAPYRGKYDKQQGITDARPDLAFVPEPIVQKL
jgi:dCTP deaminase